MEDKFSRTKHNTLIFNSHNNKIPRKPQLIRYVEPPSLASDKGQTISLHRELVIYKL